MRIIVIIIVFVSFFILPVSAMEYTAPPAPESAQPYMPPDQENFAQGLLYIIQEALSKINPELVDASKLCFVVKISAQRGKATKSPLRIEGRG